jgi:hypothetical protein
VNRKPRSHPDPVSPALAGYIVGRDGECVVGKLARAGRIRDFGPCRNAYGIAIRDWTPRSIADLTIAHVRDRGRGGRTGRRPRSIPRRLVAACHGHHIADPVVDRAEVRDELDVYLEALEGPEPAPERWWEAVQRVRGPDRGARLSDPTEREGGRGRGS